MEHASQKQKAKSRKIKFLEKNILPYLFAATLSLMLFFSVRLFLFEIVRVNGKDMQNTFFYGDAVLVKKAFNTYERNDVIYFHFPIPDSSETKIYCIQRIAGASGDTVELKNKVLFVNSICSDDDSVCIKHNYFVKAKQRFDTAFKFMYHLNEGGEISNKFDYSYSLSLKEELALEQDTLVKSIKIKAEDKGNYDENCFPYNPYYSWNIDHYGKIYVPKKGDTLSLDTNNIHLYRLLINTYENNKLEVLEGKIYINDEESTYYIVKRNYYFVLGDNRDNAIDSRLWGYLPEKYIIGKVVYTVKRASP